jgi:DNA-binding transcriptional LysR family regulator
MGQAVLELGVCNDLHAASTIVNRISRPQLRAFLGIIDHGTYLKAAQALDLTQTSLQRAARDFEAHLRTTVCFRSASGVLVSPEGAEIGRKLRLAAQEIEWGIREIGAARGAKNSTIVIGGLPFGGTVLLADVLDAFLQAHPSADVRIVTEGATEMLKRLRSGEVDLTVGIVQEVPGDDLRTERLAVTPYRIVCRPNHPLSATRDISLDQLGGYDWVVGAEGSSRRACFDALFAGHEKPRAPIATSSLPIIRHLLTDNDRLTLMTTYELGHDSAGLMSLPFAASHPAPSIGVTTRAGWLPTSLHDEFLTLLRASVTEWSSVSARRESVSAV